jgi:hypothetical protein
VRASLHVGASFGTAVPRSGMQDVDKPFPSVDAPDPQASHSHSELSLARQRALRSLRMRGRVFSAFLPRKAACIGRGLFPGSSGPSLPAMSSHPHITTSCSVSSSRARATDTGRTLEGSSAMRALLRVAAALLIAIPVFLTLVILFALAARRGATPSLESERSGSVERGVSGGSPVAPSGIVAQVSR